jgi:hypothetical protein
MADWPTHADGANKRFGQMTDEEQSAVMAAARARWSARLADQPDYPEEFTLADHTRAMRRSGAFG